MLQNFTNSTNGLCWSHLCLRHDNFQENGKQSQMLPIKQWRWAFLKRAAEVWVQTHNFGSNQKGKKVYAIVCMNLPFNTTMQKKKTVSMWKCYLTAAFPKSSFQVLTFLTLKCKTTKLSVLKWTTTLCERPLQINVPVWVEKWTLCLPTAYCPISSMCSPRCFSPHGPPIPTRPNHLLTIIQCHRAPYVQPWPSSNIKNHKTNKSEIWSRTDGHNEY